MPNDALTYFFVAKELNLLLGKGRIDKISMPSKDEIILHIRADKKNHMLVISCGVFSRIHLISENKPSPLSAFSFCMNLRKHISGGIVKGIVKEDDERVIIIDIEYRNELGIKEDKKLICEIMGKYSNIILTDANFKIYESLKHIPMDSGNLRPIFPGLIYTVPTQSKLSPFDTKEIEELDLGLDPYATLQKNVKGLAPISISEAIYNSENKKISIGTALKELYTLPINPSITENDFFIRPYECLNGQEYKFFGSINEALDSFYSKKAKTNYLSEKSKGLMTICKNALKRAEKRLSEFYLKQQNTQGYEIDRIRGELITSNIYRIKSGDSILIAQNYYNENEEISIKLDVNLSPSQNAQKYFKRYAKNKRALLFLDEQIKKTEIEISSLNSVLEDFETICELSDLNDIAEEMLKLNLIKTFNRDKNIKPSKPYRFEFEGFNIYVGKNNIQNEKLTKNANRNDIFLHVKSFSGSHVIIESNNKEIPDSVILFAAGKASEFSKNKSDKIEVDYTKVKNVSKPSGFALGRVIYDNYKTIIISKKD